MHRAKAISATHEMYLKALYAVRGSHEVARSRDLAHALGVKPGTVSGVLKKLKDLDLVEHQRYGVVALTSSGAGVAECLQRRFQTIRDVLVEVFGIDPATAEEDACMMEHAASPATINKMSALLSSVRSGELRIPGTIRAAADRDCDACEAASTCLAGSSSARAD